MIEAQANRRTAVWRKNLDRYESRQRDKIAGIIRAVNESDGAHFCEGEEEYTCANTKKLRAAGTGIRVSKSGYESKVTVYECEGCEGCPVRERCTDSQTNRRMEVSNNLLGYRAESLARITCAEGILLRVNRSIQAEGAFGAAKEDHYFRRFFTRGKAGVSCELFLVCFGYNVNKLHRKITTGPVRRLIVPVKTSVLTRPVTYPRFL
jgi:hypothetical protein